jgi:hypothetical protein
MRAGGESDTEGGVAEQPIEVLDAAGEAVRLRRIRVRLKTPTREGESKIYSVLN